MAESVGKLALKVVAKDCSVASCPYRYGDQSYSKRAEERIEKQLKHRVADGNEVKELEKRVKDLELGITRVLDWGKKRLNQHDLAYLKGLLEK